MVAMLSSLLGACTASWNPAYDEVFPEDERGTVEIAEPGEALTFARMDVDGKKRVLAVTGYRNGFVDGVDLGDLLGRDVDDPVSLFVERGYDALKNDVASAPAAARRRVDAGGLAIPVDFGERHIAVGTNYPEHASDAGTTKPFLFPKVVQPGRAGDEVSTRASLLDYEVEIAAVTLEPVAAGAAPAFVGLMLANDFTDRGLLFELVDRHDIESGKGFTTAKSFPGSLPVGNLLVIPRDWRAFVPGLELRLFVNGALRQRSRASLMVWDTAEVFAQVFGRRGARWDHAGTSFALFDGDAIPARTLVLTGTPHGTVFDGIPPRVIAAGLLRWFAGGWTAGIPVQVVAAYRDAATKARAYLQPGDEVAIHVQRLGELKSRVVP